MVSEKVGGAEGTKLDDDFRDLERVRECPLSSLLLDSMFELFFLCSLALRSCVQAPNA